MDLRIFGIRHHGPGSTRRLIQVLEAWQPDALLVEAPADGRAAVSDLVKTGMKPPVALVLYAEKDIERAAYLPFAHFSPEYQALRWAIQRGVDVDLIDLPATHFLAEAPPPKSQAELFSAPPVPPSADELTARRLRRDPLSVLARLASYPDSERWWDATVERGGGQDAQSVFDALLAAVTQLRTTYPTAADEETLRREAFMRQRLRAATKRGYERIAVVVGAWHGPALAEWKTHKVGADKAWLKGLPKTKVKAAWVPWSYPRLAQNRGYGAGLVSPAWYDFLYANPATATERWMVTAARLLREEGFPASPALATDAVRLARTLAALRGRQPAGTDELEDALLGTLAAGAPERLDLIHDRLTVGRSVGRVPPGAAVVPLLADLQRELKSTRLAKLWEVADEHYLKATKANPRGGIDLRQSIDLRKSHLLHRMGLLDIPWGTLQPISPNAIGSFKEIWLLEWQPEYSLAINERGGYGNTLPLAAEKYILEKAASENRATMLAQWILAVLRAGIPTAVPPLVRRLREQSSGQSDTNELLATLPTLVSTLRYGDSRKTDTSSLLLLVEELVPRLAAGLPVALRGLDEDRQKEALLLLARADYAVSQTGGDELIGIWRQGVKSLIDPAAEVAAAPRGLALRLLFDHGELDDAATAVALRYALSSARPPAEVAGALSGFLYGGSQLLLHFAPLWELVNEWVSELAWDEFERTLPLLRRSLTDVSPAEKRLLFERVKREENEPRPTGESATSLVEIKEEQGRNEAATETLLPALREWL